MLIVCQMQLTGKHHVNIKGDLPKLPQKNLISKNNLKKIATANL